MIISYSNEGDKVLDPMCGSGTTCKMAYLNNRKFIGIDMSEQYINDICIPRLEKYGYNKNNNNMERCI
jgi:DNA modification methylase